MKIIGRTLIILAAALVVAGALFAFRQTEYARMPGESRPGRMRIEAGEARPDGFAPGGFEHRNRAGGDEHQASLAGLVEVGKNLAIIAAIVALVVMLERVTRGLRQRTVARQVETEPPS